MNFRNAVVAFCLGSTAWGAAALSLGQARGAVVLGRPVDLAFDVHTDPGQSLDGACITANLISGDSPVAGARVRVTPLPMLPGRAPAVRVQSSMPAVEPVLTVVLQVGCAGKITRTYTFLADLPETLAAGARPVAIPLAGGAEAVATAPQGTPADGFPSVERRPAAALPLSQGSAAAPPATARAAAAPVVAAAPAAPRPRPAVPVARQPKRPSEPVRSSATPQSRLVMEPLENWLQNPSTLRLSTELNLPDVPATPEQREQALAHWKALSMRPEDLLKEGAATAVLNQELAQLRTQATQERDAAQQQIERLEIEKSERYSGTLVYLLGGLVVLMAALVAWIATRLRSVSLQAQRAWAAAVAQPSPSGAPEASLAEPALAPLPAMPTAAPSLQPTTPARPEPPLPQRPTARAPAVAAAPVEPLVMAGAFKPAPIPKEQSALLINPEELFDLQQQAEFFVSVGEHDQAIGVLKQYIATNAATSPSAYLELLRLYRSLSRVDDFNQLRAQFHHHFNALLPEFAGINRPGRPLWAYSEVLARIEAVWSDESVLPLLDSLLFRHEDARSDRFDLAAYEDLLLLNAIARTTTPSARGAPPPRERTTPLAGAVDELELPTAAIPSVQAPAAAMPLDSGDSLLEYDSSWLLDTRLKSPPPGPQGEDPEATPAVLEEGSMEIDFDLSEPFQSEPVPLPPLTESDLPPLPASSAPGADEPIGFGTHSDRFEARFELEPRKPQ